MHSDANKQYQTQLKLYILSSTLYMQLPGTMQKIIHAVKFGTNNTRLFESGCFQQRICNFPP